MVYKKKIWKWKGIDLETPISLLSIVCYVETMSFWLDNLDFAILRNQKKKHKKKDNKLFFYQKKII